MILGLDAATKKTGYSIMQDENNIVDYGLIKTKSDNYIDRIKEIYFALVDIIDNNKDIHMIVAEDVPVNNHNNLKTGKELTALQGVLLALSYQYNLQIKLYNPSSHRSINGLYDGTRQSMKRDYQKQIAVDTVNKLYNLNFNYYKNDTKQKKSDDDIAEAILIARAFFLENKEE